MNLYIEFDLDGVNKLTEKELLKYAETELTKKELLEVLTTLEQKRRLLGLFFKYDTIYLGDLILKKYGANKWRIADKKPTVQRHILRVLNTLPWEAGMQLNITSDKVIETILDVEKQIEEKELGTSCNDYSDDELKYFYKKVKGSFGSKLIINFDTVKEILKTVDDCISDLYFS